MHIAKKSLALILCLLFVIALTAGCGGKTEPAKPAAAPAADKPLKVGVTPGPHAQIMEVVKKVAEKDGLKIQIVEFSDYVQPNVALNQGDIDINSFQHLPFLENMVKDRKYDLVMLAKTFTFPMGIYSKKIKNIKDLKDGAVIAMPNDPTNGGRALLLFEKAGLIKLKPGLGHKASVVDIVDNPRKFKIRELEAAQIPRTLEDMEIAAINTNYAMSAGLVPAKDALILEDSSSPYANILAVRGKDKDNPVYKKFLKAYQSEEVKKFVTEQFKGSVIVAW
ncbi:MAG: MetQ/NlpA family ABC transporter substrate-binding protein [Veillonellaceae bacterium]|nr:MetQ/NlpA family ABC transporter substrate-binding protein [Veillonellaceae bacterium]